jgi:tetratricopeptide (TPR) repeat protein
VALFQLGRYEEALAAFSEALERSPGFEEALFNRALAAEQLGQLEKARQDWERFLSLSGDSGWRREAEQHLNSLKK